jgi:hypothetical protein
MSDIIRQSTIRYEEHEHTVVNCLGVKPRGLSVDSRSNCVGQ